jgi:putative membrane protein
MKRLLAVFALTAAAVGCTDMNGNNQVGYNNNQPAVQPQQDNFRNAPVADRESMRSQTGNLMQTDRDFLKQAAMGGKYEVDSSQLALRKTNDAHVHAVAQHLIEDHTKANADVTALASKKGLTLDGKLSPEQEQMMSRLNSASDADFSREYLSQQEKAHRDTIAQFETAASSATDPEVKTLATKMLPTLRTHLQMITGQQPQNVGSEK